MLKRAWLLCSAVWAALVMWLATHERVATTSNYVVAFGPLVVPWALRTFIGYVRHGSDYFSLRTVRKP